jgi:hypothetical protein
MHFLMHFLSKTAWRVYLNATGVHSNLRRHLQNKHQKDYNFTIHNAKLKVARPKSRANSAEPHSPVTQESLLQHLVEWITATDQVHLFTSIHTAKTDCFNLSRFVQLNIQAFGSFSSTSLVILQMRTFLVVPSLHKQSGKLRTRL